MDKKIEEKCAYLQKIVVRLEQKVLAQECTIVTMSEKLKAHEVADNGNSGTIDHSKTPVVKKTKKKKKNTKRDPLTSSERTENFSEEKDEWKTVKGGKGRKPKLSAPSAVKTSNRFGLLSKEETSALLIGDSLTRDQEKYFAAVPKTKRTVKCFPGATNNKISNELEKVKVKDRKMPIIANVSGNDLFLKDKGTGNTEQILHDAGLIINELRVKTENGILIGLLPRKGVSAFSLSKAIGINWRLQDMCVPHGIRFVDPYDFFYGHSELFAKDGVHLNHRGKIVYGDMANQVVYRALHSNPKRTTINKDKEMVEQKPRTVKCSTRKTASISQETSSSEERTGSLDSEGSRDVVTSDQSGNE